MFSSLKWGSKTSGNAHSNDQSSSKELSEYKAYHAEYKKNADRTCAILQQQVQHLQNKAANQNSSPIRIVQPTETVSVAEANSLFDKIFLDPDGRETSPP
jgi:hypothetical protein